MWPSHIWHLIWYNVTPLLHYFAMKKQWHFSHACCVFSVLNVTKVIQTKQRKKKQRKKKTITHWSWAEAVNNDHLIWNKVHNTYPVAQQMHPFTPCQSHTCVSIITIEEISICVFHLDHILCFSFWGHWLRAQKQEVCDWVICGLILSRSVVMAIGLISSHRRCMGQQTTLKTNKQTIYYEFFEKECSVTPVKEAKYSVDQV